MGDRYPLGGSLEIYWNCSPNKKLRIAPTPTIKIMEPTILTIDDSKTIRMIVGRAFKNYACKIVEAANGAEGLAVAAKEKPDLIILDITMPVMDGYETLAKLKSDSEMKDIPVVMLTAEAGRENVMKIAKMGVRDYLVKPFQGELVIERLSRIIDLQPKAAKETEALN